MNWQIALSILGIVFAPVLTYIVAVRKASGRIDTTDAERLWDEAERMRAAYQDENSRLRIEVESARKELDALRAEAVAWRAEAAARRDEVAQLRKGTQ